jgi:chromosome segregation ATPase
MARITTVAHARKAQGECPKCRTPINVGDSYKHASPRAGRFTTGRKLIRCANCVFRPSELMTSPKKQALAAAEEGFQDATMSVDQPSDWVGALNDYAEEVRSVAEEYSEGAQNIEDGFGHATSQSEEMQSNAEELESWADELTSAADNAETLQNEYDELTEAEAEWNNSGLGPDDMQTCPQCSHEQKRGTEWGSDCEYCGDAEHGVGRLEALMEEASNTAEEAAQGNPL